MQLFVLLLATVAGGCFAMRELRVVANHTADLNVQHSVSQGGFLYVADSQRLLVFNLSDLSQLGSLPVSHMKLESLVARDGMVYMLVYHNATESSREKDVVIVNARNPARPFVAGGLSRVCTGGGRYNTSECGLSRGLATHANGTSRFLYVALDRDVVAYNVTDPSRPVVGNLGSPGWALPIWWSPLENGRFLIAVGGFSVSSVVLTDPMTPTFGDYYALPNSMHFPTFQKAEAAGDVLYVLVDYQEPYTTRMGKMDISTPTPRMVGEMVDTGGAWKIAAAQHRYLWVASSSISLYDASGSTVSLVGTYPGDTVLSCEEGYLCAVVLAHLDYSKTSLTVVVAAETETATLGTPSPTLTQTVTEIATPTPTVVLSSLGSRRAGVIVGAAAGGLVGVVGVAAAIAYVYRRPRGYSELS